jgi:hypothetical protein
MVAAGVLVLLAVAALILATQAKQNNNNTHTRAAPAMLQLEVEPTIEADYTCYANDNWHDARIKDCPKSNRNDCVQLDCNFSLRYGDVGIPTNKPPCESIRRGIVDTEQAAKLAGPNLSTTKVWQTTTGEINTVIHYYRAPQDVALTMDGISLSDGEVGKVSCTRGSYVRCCT